MDGIVQSRPLHGARGMSRAPASAPRLRPARTTSRVPPLARRFRGVARCDARARPRPSGVNLGSRHPVFEFRAQGMEDFASISPARAAKTCRSTPLGTRQCPRRVARARSSSNPGPHPDAHRKRECAARSRPRPPDRRLGRVQRAVSRGGNPKSRHVVPQAPQGKRPPAGWDLIEESIEDFEQQMKDAVAEEHEGKRRTSSRGASTTCTGRRTLHLRPAVPEKVMSEELYNYLCEKVADQALISKWRKPGYENLCSLLAIQKDDTNFGTASICACRWRQRAPPQQLAPTAHRMHQLRQRRRRPRVPVVEHAARRCWPRRMGGRNARRRIPSKTGGAQTTRRAQGRWRRRRRTTSTDDDLDCRRRRSTSTTKRM